MVSDTGILPAGEELGVPEVSMENLLSSHKQLHFWLTWTISGVPSTAVCVIQGKERCRGGDLFSALESCSGNESIHCTRLESVGTEELIFM